jgi:hypothetical protein
MESWDFRDLVTGDAVEDPLKGTVPIAELRREHLVRFILRTSKGLVILRPMPLRLRRIIDAVQAKLYPRRAELEREAVMLLPYFEGIPEEDVDPDARRRMEEIAAQLQVTDMSAMGVIVAPAMGTMEDVEELYDSLTDAERIQLSLAIRDLSRPIPPERVDATALEIERANGLVRMDQEMLDMLTVSQAAFWVDRINKENRRTEEMAKRLQGRR